MKEKKIRYLFVVKLAYWLLSDFVKIKAPQCTANSLSQ